MKNVASKNDSAGIVDVFRGVSGSSIEFLGSRVRKRARPGQEGKLIAQARHMRLLHNALGEHCLNPLDIGDDNYTMDYYPGVSLDVYCTMCSQQVAFYRVREIIKTLWERMYVQQDQPFDVSLYIVYLRERLQAYADLRQDVSELDDLLVELVDCFNGKTVLEQCKAGLVHGDLTFENILITADSFTLVDLNPPPSGTAPWTLDAGKLRQSLFSFYEITKYSGIKSRSGLESTYTFLADRFSRLFPFWNEAFDLQSRFFEISHYVRLLDYKFNFDPDISTFYYIRSVGLLKDIISSLSLMYCND